MDRQPIGVSCREVSSSRRFVPLRVYLPERIANSLPTLRPRTAPHPRHRCRPIQRQSLFLCRPHGRVTSQSRWVSPPLLRRHTEARGIRPLQSRLRPPARRLRRQQLQSRPPLQSARRHRLPGTRRLFFPRHCSLDRSALRLKCQTFPHMADRPQRRRTHKINALWHRPTADALN